MMLALTVKEVKCLGNRLMFGAVRERGRDCTSSGEGRESAEEDGEQRRASEGTWEIAVMMCMREGDSERQGEGV